MNARLILGDALCVLPTLEAGSVDCVITDPPYNVGLEYGSSNDDRADYAEWCCRWFTECQRVCKKGGAILITPGIVNVGMWHTIRKPNWMLCWHKPACMGRSPIGFNNWEPVLLYGKLYGKGNVDVFQAVIKPDPGLEGHPCPKPLQWAKAQIEKAVERGGAVLDPFAGSGTTLVAALLTGRNAIGIEIDPAYHAIAQRRIDEVDAIPPLVQAASLFDAQEE